MNLTENFQIMPPTFHKIPLTQIGTYFSTELICKACNNLLKDPLICRKCEQLICSDCRYINNPESCPFCYSKVIPKVASKPILNVLNDVVLFCFFANNGCEKTSKYEEIYNHGMECIHNPSINAICKHCNLNMTSGGNYKELQDHYNKCPEIKISCDKCFKVITRKERINHNKECFVSIVKIENYIGENKLFNITEIRILKSKILSFPGSNKFRIELCKELYEYNFAFLNSLNRRFVTKFEYLDELIKGKTNPQLEEFRIKLVDSFCRNVINFQIAFHLKDNESCDKMLVEAKILIDQINYINNKIVPVIQKKKEKKRTIRIGKLITCKICNITFSNNQALGGHMSRSHPNQSKQYKMKKEVRMKREKERSDIHKARVILFQQLGLDYQSLVKNNDRHTIKEIRLQNMNQYKDILNKLRRT